MQALLLRRILQTAILLVAFVSASHSRAADEVRPNGDAKPAAFYNERYRPQFHFSPRTNWTNDPNGMVYYQGQYHLFFQHNPQGINWGNMTWGHAVSDDMLHWRQVENAIEPDGLGTIFSGSAVVDTDNTAGFQQGDEKTIVCIYTSAGGTNDASKGKPFTQSIAYSTDGGKTFKKYDKNPVLKHIRGENRDPKVFWHAPSKQWVMALFLDGNDYALFGSPNLKEWTKLCDVPFPGSSECPDFFALPVDGNATKMKWVFWGANNNYMLGSFDGQKFVKEAGPFSSHFGGNRYASQTFSNLPVKDMRIQIGWMNGGSYPGMPFNQQMSVPVELTLRTFPEGVRLCTEPVREIASLRGTADVQFKGELKTDDPLAGLRGDLFDIVLDFKTSNDTDLTLNVRGSPIHYLGKDNVLSCLGHDHKLEPKNDMVSLRILVDRTSIEIFTDQGKTNMATCFLPPDDNKKLSLTSHGAVTIENLQVWPLRSTWRETHTR